MRVKTFFLPVILGFVLILSGCGNHELKKEAAKVGDAMCRNIEIMNKIRDADPEDSVTLQKLQMQAHQLEIEMTIVYKEFGDKFGDKTKDPKFIKKFNRELRKTMLDCPSLSQKDRDLFEKKLNE